MKSSKVVMIWLVAKSFEKLYYYNTGMTYIIKNGQINIYIKKPQNRDTKYQERA